MKMIFLVMVALASLALAGCSSVKTREDVAKDEAKAEAVRASVEEEKRTARQKRMETEVAQVPTWAMNPPKPDDTGIYAVGIAESDKIGVAIQKARLEAEFGLAKNYAQELSGSERLYTQDNAGAVTKAQYVQLIDKLVNQVSLVGFEVRNQEVKPLDGKYHAYVMLRLPYAQFNKIMQDQRARTEDKEIKGAFDELERRVKERRKQAVEEEILKGRQMEAAPAAPAEPKGVAAAPSATTTTATGIKTE